MKKTKITTNKELKDVFEVMQDRLLGIRKEVPWTDKNVYLGWLAQTYEYAVNSTRILAMTGGRMPLDKTSFANRFFHHACEEKGHERLLENDVKSFGLDIKDLEVLPLAKAFHQSLYYWFGFGNPVGMFGWVLALEGFAVKNVPEMNDICFKAFGSKATSFLKVHAAEDTEHLEKAFESIQGFTAEENNMVAQSLMQYAELYGSILKQITMACKFTNNRAS